jgi:hypothetical protein
MQLPQLTAHRGRSNIRRRQINRLPMRKFLPDTFLLLSPATIAVATVLPVSGQAANLVSSVSTAGVSCCSSCMACACRAKTCWRRSCIGGCTC